MSEEFGYQFGPFRLDLLTHRLLRDERPVPLTPKAIDMLHLLLDRRDRVVGKDELMKALWPDSFVEEANLAQHVFMLRKALGSQPDGQPYIETVPKRGYRFAAHAREVTEPRGVHSQPAMKVSTDEAVEPSTVVGGAAEDHRRSTTWRGSRWVVAGIAVFLVGVAAVIWRGRSNEQQRVSEVIASVEAAANRNDLDAVHTALLAAGVDPADRRLAPIASRITGALSVETNSPASIRAFRVRLHQPFLTHEFFDLGSTPLSNRPLVAGEYVIELSGPGVTPTRALVNVRPGEAIRIDRAVAAPSEIPAGMAFVEAGPVQVGADAVRVPAFFIDRHEVTNGEFQQFVMAGKYHDGALWPDTLVVGGRSLPRASALSLLVDRTGLPGPRTWSNGRYPEGREDHPVVGVSWYEAAAYARWIGKQLPSFAQWRRAALGERQSGFPWGPDAQTAEQRANFGLAGTSRVDAYPGGLSPFGCSDMAGNAREWLRNEAQGARHAAAGASWLEPSHDFERLEWFDAAQATPGIGFRLVARAAGQDDSDETAAFAPRPGGVVGHATDDPWLRSPVSDRSFESIARLFAYDAHASTDATIVETKVTDGVTVDRLTFHSAPGAKVPALLLHTAATRGRPGVVLLHSAGATGKDLPNNVALGMLMARAGWSVIAIDLPHFGERATDLLTTFSDDEKHSQLYNQPGVYLAWMTQAVRDVRRAHDVLVQQTGADARRIALVGASRGAIAAMVAAGVDTRFGPVALLFAGHSTTLERDHPEAVCPANFIPRIAPRPLLMLNSVNDQTFPPTTAVRPLFALAGAPKDTVWTDGGHMVLTDPDVANVMKWLREHIG